MTYALALSEEERRRYHLMAAMARTEEAASWAAAGVRPGAVVADVGCGPGAVLHVLAEEVGAQGRADGVDQAVEAVTAATAEVSGLPQASVRQGDATATGLSPGTYDLVMCRHVLAHNGGREAAIVSHLAQLARPGGTVYLVDVDSAALWMHPFDPDLQDLMTRYRDYHAARGNDLSIGRALGSLLESAGLTVEIFRSGGPVLRVPPGIRGPAWAARDAMVAAGFATGDDLARWSAAFERQDTLADRPWFASSACVAVGRVPA